MDLNLCPLVPGATTLPAVPQRLSSKAQFFLKKNGRFPSSFMLIFGLFHMTQLNNKLIKAGWKAQMNPLSYGGTHQWSSVWSRIKISFQLILTLAPANILTDRTI